MTLKSGRGGRLLRPAGGGPAGCDDRQAALLELDPVPRREHPPHRPLREGHGFGADLDDVVTGGELFGADVRPAHDPSKPFEVQSLVLVAVPDQHRHRRDRLQLVENDVPVGDARVQRIVADENRRLQGLSPARQKAVEPAHVLGRPVPVAHPQDRTLREPDETEAVALKDKAVVAPEPGDVRTARFGPFRVVIAGDDVVRDAEPVEDLLGQAEIGEGSHLRDISGDQDERQSGQGVDVGDRGPEVVGAPVRADVRIAHPGKAQRRPARREGRRRQEAENEQSDGREQGGRGKLLHGPGSLD